MLFIMFPQYLLWLSVHSFCFDNALYSSRVYNLHSLFFSGSILSIVSCGSNLYRYMSQLNCLSVPQNSIVGPFIPVSSSNSLTAAIHDVSPSSTFPPGVCNFPFIGALYRSLIHIPWSL